MSRNDCSKDRESVAPQLRQRFMIWSLAVASSLTTTGMVSLAPSAAWAQEETTEKAAGDKSKNEDAKVTDQEEAGEAAQEAVEKKPFDRSTYTKMLRERKYTELASELEQLLSDTPENDEWVSMYSSVLSYLSRTDSELAREKFRAQLESLMDGEKLSNAQGMALARAAQYLPGLEEALDVEDKKALVNDVIGKLRADAEKHRSAIRQAITTKSRLLIESEEFDALKEEMDQLIAECRERIDLNRSGTISEFTSNASLYYSMVKEQFPEAAEAVMQEAEQMALDILNSEDAKWNDFSRLYNLKSGAIGRAVYEDPEMASEQLAELEQHLEALLGRFDEEAKAAQKQFEAAQSGLKRYESSLGRLKSSIESSLERLRLVGTPAPEIDAEAFVATDAVTMDDLKGKVVLIDFWAVWCGPCIATFPHLVEWHEQYSDQGLVILGATKFYGYEWDEEAGRATRGEDVDQETELAMLEKFRESYGLHHGFFVSGDESEYSKAFKVSGIPQAVLIDREGKIQMIRVGSGEANAKALHDKIEELLE